jgi:hypothetical protein
MKALVILILIILGIMALRKNTRIVIQRQQPQTPARKEGDVTLDTSGSKHKGKNRNDGEYVDYTEVKE